MTPQQAASPTADPSLPGNAENSPRLEGEAAQAGSIVLSPKQTAAQQIDLPSSHVPLATSDFCRPFGGCVHKFRSLSEVPASGEMDPELRLGRTVLYKLMKTLVNGVPLIEFYELHGKRLMDGASKCRLLRSTKNKPLTHRGGDRRREKRESPPSPDSTGSIAPVAISTPATEPAPSPTVTPPIPSPSTEVEKSPVTQPIVENPAPAPDGKDMPKQPILHEIPVPLRLPDGKLDWDAISDESLAATLKKFSGRRIAKSWGVAASTVYRQIANRKAHSDAFDFAPVVPGKRYRASRYQRPSKIKLLELLWTMPATHIAKQVGCTQGTILLWAKDWSLKGPGPNGP